MGSAAGKPAENTVNEAAAEPSNPPTSDSTSSSSSQNGSPLPPTIIITAPSREDLLSQKTGLSIAEANKERRPGSPVVVGGRFIKRKA
ncbi:hypothetical protein AOLI_G00055380 [Acnodon oligacanthus]